MFVHSKSPLSLQSGFTETSVLETRKRTEELKPSDHDCGTDFLVHTCDIFENIYGKTAVKNGY